MECYWIRNTEATLAKLREASEGVAMVPLGSIESHGPHLPLGSDPIKTDNLVRHIVEQETVAVLPTVPYSYVAAARVLPGAIHIPSALLIDWMEQICDEIHRNGFNKIVLLHGHGGNVALHQMICSRMLEKEKPYALYSLSAQADRMPEMFKLMDHPEQGHACEWETSLNMVACPELVDLKALGDRTFPTVPGPDTGAALTPVDYISRHPDMAIGKPQLATKEKGEQILAMAVEGVVRHLRMIKKDTKVLEVMQWYRQRAQSVATRP